jgi:hypothetical protein
METSGRNSHELHWLTLPAVTVAVGLASGLGGMVLGLLLHFIQTSLTDTVCIHSSVMKASSKESALLRRCDAS